LSIFGGGQGSAAEQKSSVKAGVPRAGILTSPLLGRLRRDIDEENAFVITAGDPGI
jgi:hypothetical protein